MIILSLLNGASEIPDSAWGGGAPSQGSQDTGSQTSGNADMGNWGGGGGNGGNVMSGLFGAD